MDQATIDPRADAQGAADLERVGGDVAGTERTLRRLAPATDEEIERVRAAMAQIDAYVEKHGRFADEWRSI